MIYINKQKPDKEVLDKIAEIKNSLEWKQAGDFKPRTYEIG